MKRIWICWLLLGALITGQGSGTAQDNVGSIIQADDANNLELLTMLRGHTAPVSENSFSPDGSAFITAGFDSKVCVWNVEALGQVAGQLRFCLDTYLPGITMFAWSSDGSQLAVYAGDRSSVDVYETTKAHAVNEWMDIQPVKTIDIGNLSLIDLEFTANNSQLIAIDLDGVLSLYSLSLRAKLFEHVVVDFRPDPSRSDQIYLLDEDGHVLVMDTALGIIRRTLDVEAENMQMSPDGAWLATWNDEKTLLWEVESLLEEDYMPETMDIAVEGARFSRESVLLATWAGEVITIWDMESLTPTGTLRDHVGGVQNIVFNGDSTRAFSITTRGRARFWQFDANRAPLPTVWLDDEVDQALVSPDGETLILTRADFVARFYNFTNARLRGNYPISTQALFSPDWSLIAEPVGELVLWVGLPDTNRRFAWEPVGTANGLVNVRSTPSQDLPRIATLANGSPVFAFGRTEDGQWLQVQLPDGTQGWVQQVFIRVSDSSAIDNLPVVESDEPR